MDGWMDRWTDGRMDGWMDGCLYVCMYVMAQIGMSGCRGWGASLQERGGGWGGGLAMSFSGQFVLHWYPPDTQLSPVAPKSCIMQQWPHPLNWLGWGATPGEGSQSGLKPSNEPDRGYLPKHAKTGYGGVSRRERFSSNGHEGGDCKRRGAERVQQGTTDVVAIHYSQGSPQSRRFSIPLDPGF